jgi:signal transduction histidine kinase
VIQLALIVASATLAVGLGAVVVLRVLPTVRLQLAGLAFLAVVLPLTAVLLSGWVMFHMGADVKILAVASASATVAVGAALIIAWSISARMRELERTAREIAAGDLAARAAVRRPRELEQLAQATNEMAENLERIFDARRQLVAWASHDLRTPLTSLRAMLEAIEDGLAASDQYLPAIREQVDRLGLLVDDLFELARIDAGVLTIELRDAPLTGMVASCLRGLEAEARSRQVRLEARIPQDMPAVRCAPEQVERVLFNLLTNALRHTPSDGSVAVVIEPDGLEVQVTVEDTGEGLTAEAPTRMFERFWRGDAARTAGNGGGAGLGLAIAEGLVHAQGGRIWAEPRPDGGARVCFTLPIAT